MELRGERSERATTDELQTRESYPFRPSGPFVSFFNCYGLPERQLPASHGTGCSYGPGRNGRLKGDQCRHLPCRLRLG
jgi:hypothetical protein